MTRIDPANDAEAYVDAASALLGVELAPEHRPGVVRDFRLIARKADLVTRHPLERRDEPAPVFRPAGDRP